jgi:hypothetical protein
MNTWIKRIAVVVAVLGLAAVAIRKGMVWNKTRDVMPTLTPVADGPRAPAFSLFGTTIGTTTFADVQARATAAGWNCRDTSMRGLMAAGRADAQARIAQAEAEGKETDTVSGASRAYYYSKKEQNPQIQWTCEDVDLHKLDPAYPTEPDNTAVFIFDSAERPLRYMLLSRHYQSQKAAIAALDAGVARFSAALGAPMSSSGEPDLDPTHKAFPRLQLVRREWSYADRHGLISVMNLGPAKGIDVRELWEVPWPTEVVATR